MDRSTPVTIAVDVLGAEAGPEIVFHGLAAALAEDPDLALILTGPEAVISSFVTKNHGRVEARPTTEHIGMDEHPAAAVRAKKDSSIVVGCRLVKDGIADGFFSPGSTGAILAAATLVVGRLPGVARPAIASVIPTGGPALVLLDIGANADCKPEWLVQFARMGAEYARIVLDVPAPRVGLLNIGSEEGKGSQFALEAYALMKESVPGFVGNAEGRDIFSGAFDVIVTDGFTGNVTLKVLEGTAGAIMARLKDGFSSSTRAKAAGALAIPVLRDMKRSLDPEHTGGAPLLGVKGVVCIGHGSSGVDGIKNGVLVAARAARGGLPEAIGSAIAASGGSDADA